jgi:hypothetical protein
VTDWANLPPLEPGCAMFMASDNSLHSVPLRFLRNARSIDPELVVLATSPEQWQQFVAERTEIEQQWANRNTVTDDDRELLRQMGIKWIDPMLEDFVCAILDAAIENRNADVMAQGSVRDLIDDAQSK